MADVALNAERDFERLREAVWVRFCARRRGVDRDRFEDAYSEWWAREVERAAEGAPSRAAAPAAFVAEAVHRVLLDDARARARGIGREDKASLAVVDIDEQYDLVAEDDVVARAGYEALAHRVLTLVQGHLTERERRVFVWSFLYLQPIEATADALGLSPPRVKKDRRKIAGKVGAEVWQVIGGELDLCAVYEEKSLPAIFEILTVHVEDCPTCAASLGGMRQGALAIIGPELLVVGGVTEGTSHVFSDLYARIYGLLHRGTEAFAALPPQGRTAAAVAVAATAVAGGAATVVPDARDQPRQPRVAQAASPSPVPTVATAVPTVSSRPAPAATSRPKARAATSRRARPAGTAAPAAPAPIQEELGFEQQAPVASTARTAPSAPEAPAPTEEFGFEQP